MENSNQVQVTTNYDQFQFLNTNRDQARGHVESLKRAFEEMGNLTRVQPILVNDRFQIIDGQHRYTACKELGEPIYYTMVPGLGVNEARKMNILHRGWKIDDYAKSYASAGDSNYQKYLDIKEDFGFNHSITLTYIEGVDNRGSFKTFREGEFSIEDEAGARDRLSKLADVGMFAPMVNDRYFARAFLRILTIEGYDHKRILKKLQLHENLLRRYASLQDYLRMLEEIYNHQISEANRLRLY